MFILIEPYNIFLVSDFSPQYYLCVLFLALTVKENKFRNSYGTFCFCTPLSKNSACSVVNWITYKGLINTLTHVDQLDKDLFRILFLRVQCVVYKRDVIQKDKEIVVFISLQHSYLVMRIVMEFTCFVHRSETLTTFLPLSVGIFESDSSPRKIRALNEWHIPH